MLWLPEVTILEAVYTSTTEVVASYSSEKVRDIEVWSRASPTRVRMHRCSLSQLKTMVL